MTYVCDTVFPTLAVFCTLGIEELDAFNILYIASKMDF